MSQQFFFEKINNGKNWKGTYKKTRNKKQDKKQDQQELQEFTKKAVAFF